MANKQITREKRAELLEQAAPANYTSHFHGLKRSKALALEIALSHLISIRPRLSQKPMLHMMPPIADDRAAAVVAKNCSKLQHPKAP